MLYWAYGSNLSFRAMENRCPGAVPLRALLLRDGALVFRSVADVVFRKGSIIAGGIWEITKDHEEELDHYEGVKSRLYMKKYLLLEVDGKKRKCLYYQMTESEGVVPPGVLYYDKIREGYRDFKLPLKYLDAAVEAAYQDKNITSAVAYRMGRRGPLVERKRKKR